MHLWALEAHSFHGDSPGIWFSEPRPRPPPTHQSPLWLLKTTKRDFNFLEKQDQTNPLGWLIVLSPPRGLSCLDMGRQGLCVPPGPSCPTTADQTLTKRKKASFHPCLHKKQCSWVYSDLKIKFSFFHQWSTAHGNPLEGLE